MRKQGIFYFRTPLDTQNLSSYARNVEKQFLINKNRRGPTKGKGNTMITISRKRLLLSILVIIIMLLGCATRKLTPEMEQISAVSDTKSCKFIKNTSTEAHPKEMIYYIKLTTSDAGGDSYKIISTDTQKVSGVNTVMVKFEVYKCK
jgi:hypothetical protein